MSVAPDRRVSPRPLLAAALLVAAVAAIALDLFGTSTEPSPDPPVEPGPCVVGDADSAGSPGRGPGVAGEVVIGFDEAEELVTVDLRTCEVGVVALDPWPQRRFAAASLLPAGDEWVYVTDEGAFAVDREFDELHRIGVAEVVPAHDGRMVWLVDESGLRTRPAALALPAPMPGAVAFGSRVAWADGEQTRMVDGATAEAWSLGAGRPAGVTADTVVVRRSGPGRFEAMGVGRDEAGEVLAVLELQLGAFLVSPGGSAMAATTSTAGVPARQRTVLVDPRTLVVDQLEAVPHSARPLVWRAAWIDDTRLAVLVDGDGTRSVSIHDRTTRLTRTAVVIEREAVASWLAAAPG